MPCGWNNAGAADLSAGITVGVVLVAQGIAYGLLAGLPGYYGLYAGLAPSFIYALFGTSRHMHIGPFGPSFTHKTM